MNAIEYIERRIEQLKNDSDGIVSDISGRRVLTSIAIRHAGEKLFKIDNEVFCLERMHVNLTGRLPKVKTVKSDIDG